MNDAKQYLQAARRASTLRRYARAIEHYEVEWKGLLPATSENVVLYLSTFGERLSSSTLRTHVAALAQWHLQRGFADPTKSSRVRDTLRGIRALHPQMVHQAEALALTELEACVAALDQERCSERPEVRLRAARDQALLMLGFWRAFRADELCRLRIEHVQLRTGKALEIFLPTSKTDRANSGRILRVPALQRLCPVDAYSRWLELSGLREGPIFRAIDRWGNVGSEGLNPNSLSRLLRRIMLRSDLSDTGYSSHSLRRGFATWATHNHWSTKALMEYVGWRDMQSAIRYVESDAPFGEWAKK